MDFKIGDKVWVKDAYTEYEGPAEVTSVNEHSIDYVDPYGVECYLDLDEGSKDEIRLLDEPVAIEPNPKKAYGATKPDLALVPPAGTLHQAMAHELGSAKYGPYNWRDQPVEAMTYIGAIHRHLQAYLDGEEYTSDSEDLVHNLGAIMAGCAILLDSMELGILIDNRPPKGTASEVQTRLQGLKKARKKA